MTTPFQLDLGVSQGRIGVAGAPDGAFVLELGHALHQARRIAVGDYFEVKQSVVLDPQTSLIRFALRVSAPEDASPVGTTWVFTGRLNGAVRVQRTVNLADSRVLSLEDLAITTLGANGPPATDEIAFRLQRTA